MNTSHRENIGIGLLALLGGLVAGGWLGFALKGGSSSSFPDALQLTAAFLALSPFMLFSVLGIIRDDVMNGGGMQIVFLVCVGMIFMTVSWILAHRSGRVRFQIGTFLGALIYNTAAGITAAAGLSA